MKIREFVTGLILILTLMISACDPAAGQIESPEAKIADHRVVHELWDGKISEADIKQAVDNLSIAYGHTSHGSQIIDGMQGLIEFADNGNLGRTYAEGLFSFNSTGSGGALHLLEGAGYGSGHLELDAGYYPSWVNETQAFIDDPACDEYNVIMWSWCGQVSGKTKQTMIDEYLAPMAAFEDAHPEIVFVYMTGHLDGTGSSGNLHLRNEQIRKYCRDNDKWLFDFADIESHDPEGNDYLDLNADDACNYTGGNWATAWQNSRTEGRDWFGCGAAHSQPLNANMKAYAAWWLFSEIAKQF